MPSDKNFEAWCSQHQMHPDECFEKHRPDVKEVRGALDEQAHRDHIEKHHRELQDAAKQKEKEERASD